MSFEDLLASAPLLKAIQEMGYTEPTPIQEQAIPEILKGLDLCASAQTGTGKTAAFLLPTLAKLTTPSTLGKKGPRVLILVPTRELAMQVAAEAATYGKYIQHSKTVCIYGGAPYPPQRRDLFKPYEILVATPGRLMDHMEQGNVDFSRLETFILDEADRMLDMGFIEAVEAIAEALPEERQTLLFSATLKKSVLRLASRLLNDPVEITVTPQIAKHENIEQSLIKADSLEHKYLLLDHLCNDTAVEQMIIFTSTKHQADELSDKLFDDGQAAAVLHGGMKQSQRTSTILQMRKGRIRILVATDVAARGLDVPAISHVVNFDLPDSPEDYVHRIGRTGRAGAKGIALSFVRPKEFHLVRRIEEFTGQKLTCQVIPGLESKAASFTKPSASVKGKRSFAPIKRERSGAPASPFVKRESSSERPFVKRESSSERPFVKRESSSERPFVKRESSSERPFVKRESSSERPFVKREPSSEKPLNKKAPFKGVFGQSKPSKRRDSFDEARSDDRTDERSFGRKKAFQSAFGEAHSFPKKKSFSDAKPFAKKGLSKGRSFAKKRG